MINMRVGPAIFTALGFLGLPTLGLAADGYYIVKEKDGTTCTVVQEKPTNGNMVLVNEVIYPTELEAKDAKTKLEACKS